LENGAFCLIVNPLGEIVSLIDKRGRGREVIAAGQVGNQFIAFDDRPLRFDAWDIDAGYERKQYAMDAATVTVTESGPLRATVHVTRRFLSSVIEQDISLHSTLWRIDFATRASWHERHLLLKAAFPLDLRATQARSEIQYGFITRPTHANTSWDEARFETVAHRWVDLCESGYGVALLNDGRYGHDIHGSTIRLTILRSPTSPDPDADQGPHEVTFSLLPYTTLFDASRVFHVVAHGYALNRPLRALPGRGVAPAPLFSVDGEQVIIEAIKRAAEGDDLTVRLYEAIGSRALARVACAYPLARVVECDLLERPLDAASSPAYDLWRDSPAASHDAPQVSGSEWTCAFRPFEIRTFRVTLARP
jgi:alpha-mannosidase